VSGATTPTLTISSLSADDVGVYSVAVFNPAGSVVSQNATVNISKYNIKDALIGYWKFDETGGTTASNSVAGGLAGTVDPSGTWGAGQVGGALGFDGFSTYVVVTNYPKATTALSVAGWVNVSPDATASMALVRNAEGNIGVSVAQDSVPGSQFELVLNADANTGALSLHAGIITGPNHTTIDGPAGFPSNSWQHVAFTVDGAQLTLYINGAAVASTPYVGTFNVPEVKELSMGARLNMDVSDPANPTLVLDGTPNVLLGQLDDIGIWNRALTADEVSKVYAAGKAGNGLTTVVEAPPVIGVPGHLTITRAAANVTITYDHGTLQTAASVNGPWTNVTTPSPVTEAASGSAKFYRTVSQ
jgi:hypothetical protein